MAERLGHGVSLATETVPYHEIHSVFAESSHGIYLNGVVRYNSYRSPNVSIEAWQQLLGVDVNNLHHMALSEQMTGTFLRLTTEAVQAGKKVDPLAQFSPEEEELMSLAGVSHDWGESVKGCEDITYRLKTEEDEEREMDALQGLMKAQAQLHGKTDEDRKILEEKMHMARVHIVGNRETKLGRAFNAIERLGYLRTGLRAWRESGRTPDPLLKSSLQWITADVLGNQTEKLLEYAQLYPPIDIYLGEHRDLMEDAFLRLPTDTFDNYGVTERQAQRQKFQDARAAFLPVPEVVELFDLAKAS